MADHDDEKLFLRPLDAVARGQKWILFKTIFFKPKIPNLEKRWPTVCSTFFSFFKIGKLFEVVPLGIAIEKENYPMGLQYKIPFPAPL